MAFKLADRETIIATHSEHATGPGWSNDWVNVLVHGADGRIRQVGVQWSEMTEEMRHLFKLCAAANKEMLGAVLRLAARADGGQDVGEEICKRWNAYASPSPDAEGGTGEGKEP